MKKTFAFAAVAGLTMIGSHIASAADITGTITFKGTPPAELPVPQVADDPNCKKMHAEAVTTHHYLVGPKGEFANVVVSLVGAPAKGAAASAPITLDQKGCEYTPLILAVQTDQKIVVKNSDPVLHNVHTLPAVAGNEEKNNAQTANGPDLVYTFSKPENFLKFKCDVHPWMFAWVTVLDHPYFSVSAKDGSFKIANVPPGKYKIQAAHRKAGVVTKEIEVKEGEAAKVDFVVEGK